MKVKLQGFKWKLNSEIPLTDLTGRLVEISGQEVETSILAVVEDGGLLKGLFLHPRDAKAFCQMQQEGGTFTITARDLEEGTNIVDFNFFVMDLARGHGVYQYYHQSAHLNRFCQMVARIYRKMLNDRRDDDLRAATSPKQKSNVRKRFQQGLEYEILVRPGTFAQKIRELKEIRNFEWQFSDVQLDQRTFRALTGNAKRVAHRVAFHEGTSAVGLAVEVAKLLKEKALRTASVRGMDPHGLEHVYKLFHDFDSFAEKEYDEVVKTVRIESRDLANTIAGAPVIDWITSVMKSDAYKKVLGDGAP